MARLTMTCGTNTTSDTDKVYSCTRNGSTEIFVNELNQMANALEVAKPKGTTYIQFPGEKSPNDLWPYFNWEDISDQYKGSLLSNRYSGEAGMPNVTGTVSFNCTRSTAPVRGSSINESTLNAFSSTSASKFKNDSIESCSKGPYFTIFFNANSYNSVYGGVSFHDVCVQSVPVRIWINRGKK